VDFLLESGDRLLLESGFALLLEEEAVAGVNYDALRGSVIMMPRLSGKPAAFVQLAGALDTEERLSGIITMRPA
jgi:hypothetical protein